MNDIVVHTITKRRINKIISNKSVGNKRMNLPQRSIIPKPLVALENKNEIWILKIIKK